MVKPIESFPYNYYDSARGWELTNPGWLTVCITNINAERHIEIVKWLYENVDGTERHSRWIMFFDHSSGFKFRYERDYIHFTLRWS